MRDGGYGNRDAVLIGERDRPVSKGGDVARSRAERYPGLP